VLGDLKHALRSIILGFGALLACLFPARKASIVNPEVLHPE